MDIIKYLIVIVVSYFLGNISAGTIISDRVAHVNIREVGSKNSGATNVFRTLGAKASLLTLVGDACKGALASLLGLALLGEVGIYVGGFFVLVGTMWPVVYKFKGGKGIATILGISLVTNPWVALCLLAVTFIMIFSIKVVSVASLVIITVYMLFYLITGWGNWPLCVFVVVQAIMVFFAHRENIKRMISGEEFQRRLDFSKYTKRKNKA